MPVTGNAVQKIDDAVALWMGWGVIGIGAVTYVAGVAVAPIGRDRDR